MENKEKSLASQRIGWYPGHMAKTRREIKEKLDLVDIVYELVDARIPVSSKIVDIDDLLKNKPKILIMTKYDLCDQKETDKFIKEYEKKGYYVVAVDLMNKPNINKIMEISNLISKNINEKRKEKGLKPRNLRALIIGIPNVGKSTLINRMVGKKVVGVANKPGFTKSLTWIRLNKNIDLLDTPGILWPKLEDQEQARKLALVSSIKEEILNKEELASFAISILTKLYKDKLEERYSLEVDNKTNIEILEEIASKRGALKKGGIIDYEKTATIVLNDFKNNAFKNITLDR